MPNRCNFHKTRLLRIPRTPGICLPILEIRSFRQAIRPHLGLILAESQAARILVKPPSRPLALRWGITDWGLHSVNRWVRRFALTVHRYSLPIPGSCRRLRTVGISEIGSGLPAAIASLIRPARHMATLHPTRIHFPRAFIPIRAHRHCSLTDTAQPRQQLMAVPPPVTVHSELHFKERTGKALFFQVVCLIATTGGLEMDGSMETR